MGSEMCIRDSLKVWGIDNIIVEGLPNLAINIAAIKSNLKADQWLIITRPNNPTGECIDDEVLVDLIQAAKNKGANVFLDEAYVEFYITNKEIEYALAYDNVVSLRTFSKAYGLAGIRLGYAIGAPYLIEALDKVRLPFEPVSYTHLTLPTIYSV